MGYKIYRLQNSPLDDEADIVIIEGSDEWTKAFKRWLEGKTPTDSKLWSKGVIACTRKKE